MGTVVSDGDQGITGALAQGRSDFGLSDVPVQHGKMLDLSVGHQHEELSNLVHSPTPIVRSQGPGAPGQF